MARAFDYLPVASPLHDQRALDAVLAELEPGLRREGGSPLGDRGPEPARPLVVLALTGGIEARLLDVWRARQATVPWEPLLLVAHGGQNSLPAALEALARVHQEGGRGQITYVAGPSDAGAWRELGDAVDGLKARGALEQLRIGAVGTPSDWLVASSPPPEVVRRRWGPTVVPLDVARVVAAARVPAGVVAGSLARAAVDGASALHGPDDSDVRAAAQVVAPLDRVVAEHHLDALSVRCFDLVTGARTSGCLALADLNDRGITAGCEGDIVSTVAIAWVRALLGEVPWMANPVRVDVPRNQLLLAHCTIARSLVRGYRLATHFESGLGVAIDGEIAAEDVTLVRIGGTDMERLWLGEGAVVPAAHEEHLCRTQLRVHLDRGSVAEVLRAPLGNHMVVVPGRHAERLRRWWELLISG